MSRNNMIVGHAVVYNSEFGHSGFINMHLNLRTQVLLHRELISFTTYLFIWHLEIQRQHHRSHEFSFSFIFLQVPLYGIIIAYFLCYTAALMVQAFKTKWTLNVSSKKS